jgi:hypothetical protein
VSVTLLTIRREFNFVPLEIDFTEYFIVTQFVFHVLKFPVVFFNILSGFGLACFLACVLCESSHLKPVIVGELGP